MEHGYHSYRDIEHGYHSYRDMEHIVTIATGIWSIWLP